MQKASPLIVLYQWLSLFFVDPHSPYDMHEQYRFEPVYKDRMPEDIARYNSEIRFTDHYIGQVFDELKERGLYDPYHDHFALNELYISRIFGPSQHLVVMDTYQFKDYSKVVADRWDEKAKAKRREEVFPLDCRKAYELGKGMVKESNSISNGNSGGSAAL